MVNDWNRNQAAKRGGGKVILSLDQETAEENFKLEPAAASAEVLYDKSWAIRVLRAALQELAEDYTRTGRGEIFQRLKPHLLTVGSAETYGKLAASLGMTEGALKVALHRLRQRFAEVVREQVAQTVENPQEVEEELRYLVSAFEQLNHGCNSSSKLL